jgi:hypothetical protein
VNFVTRTLLWHGLSIPFGIKWGLWQRSSLLVVAYLVFWEPLVVTVCALLPMLLVLSSNATFRGSMTAADIGTGSVDSLAVCEVSLEICLLFSLLPGSCHPWILIPLRFCSLYHFVLPVSFTFIHYYVYTYIVPHRKNYFKNVFIARLFVAVEICLSRRCLANDQCILYTISAFNPHVTIQQL